MTDPDPSPNAAERASAGEAAVEELLRRQKALGDFGDFVLDHDDLDEILNESCRLIAEALGADLAKVVEIERANDTALIRAGVGWNEGIVGKERISLSERSSEAFAIEQGEPVITQDIRNETRFHFPQFLKDHDVVSLVNVPIFLPGRKPWGVLQVDAQEPREFERKDIEFLKTYSMVLGPVIDRLQHVRGRQESEAKYRTLFEAIDEGFCVIEVLFDANQQPIDYVFLEINPAFERQTGISDAVGKRMREIAPEHEQHWFDIYGRIAVSGEPKRFEQRAEALGRHYDVYAFRIGEPEQRHVAILFNDIAERKRTEEALRDSEQRARLLFGELQHRVRNTLAVVRSIVRRTGESAKGVEDMVAHLQGRLDAFARVQAVVTRTAEGGVDLRAIVEDELLAHAEREGKRLTIRGPDVTLAPKPAEAISLAVHELATNAIKYGALSDGSGRLRVEWKRAGRDGAEMLEFLWSESGVRAALKPPDRAGFGLELLRHQLPYELGAATEFDFRPDGLSFRLSVPMAALRRASVAPY